MCLILVIKKLDQKLLKKCFALILGDLGTFDHSNHPVRNSNQLFPKVDEWWNLVGIIEIFIVKKPDKDQNIKAPLRVNVKICSMLRTFKETFLGLPRFQVWKLLKQFLKFLPARSKNIGTLKILCKVFINISMLQRNNLLLLFSLVALELVAMILLKRLLGWNGTFLHLGLNIN